MEIILILVVAIGLVVIFNTKFFAQVEELIQYLEDEVFYMEE